MKFRLSKQRQVNLGEFDLKTICPSLHDDPAFSADPHSNPYSVTSHDSWLSPPPLGHPVLKRANIALTLHDTSDLDSDFQLLQPPNSPVTPNSSPQHPTTRDKLPIISSALSMNQGLTSVMSEDDHRSSLRPPPKKESKKMNFLSRRQSAQPQPIKSFFSSMGKKERRHSGLPFSGDTTPRPRSVQNTEGPSASASVAPRIPEHLDQIDELDETNPWGIPIHHDGPYEVVHAQVNKRVGNPVPLGLYNMHAFQANGQTYIPPQVPTGVSLNLSPGQILHRHFLVPSVHPGTPPHPGPYTPHIPEGPLFTPPHEPRHISTFPDVESGPKVHDDPPRIQETLQHSDDPSFSIGMAMLEPEDNVPVPPRVFRSQAELPDEQDFDPYDPVNLESDHRQVPSPLVSAQPEPFQSQTSQYSQNKGSTGIPLNKLDVIQPAGHSRNNSDPPMYKEYIGDEDDGHQPSNETPSMEQQKSQSSSQTSQTSLSPPISQGPATMNGAGLQRPNKYDNGPPLNGSQHMGFLPPDRNTPRAPAVTRDQDVQVVQGMHYVLSTQTSPPILHPRQDGMPSLSVNHGNEPDVQSTHYSTSTYSSSQFQNGRKPPPHRHLPKRLVMPTPLNTGPPPNAMAPLHIGVPQSQISSQVNVKQTRFHLSPFNQHSLPRSPLGNLPMTPMHHHGNTRAEDVGGRKLRKRASMIDTPTPAPVITTVSFAPPIIGFHHNGTNDKVIASSKTEKLPRRLLSKRNT
ncbi:hypothetical protein BYT27DRAFT_7256318 [Phlegmacium glaucopus]|nr:hypothetical protein BYT27DRAFT_7256318 [Phlegmacium glaucopus]